MTISLRDAPLLQARNSAAFWAATGRSRGHQVINTPAFLAVVGDARAGTRVLIQRPDPSAEDVAAIAELAAKAAGPVNVEDPFSATDLARLELRGWQMPVMARRPAPVAAPAMEVARVGDEKELRGAERAVIESFGLVQFLPYRGGEMFPPAILDEPGVAVYAARLDGEIAGACVSVVDNGLASHYWVGTHEQFRSRGVGRAVMLGSLAPLADLPATLTASRLGRPLYESLGYAVASPSTWWASR
ncbi:MAG TPA: GNAT family N-acetyltransferase [Stackebrandtia sp.]|jgi:ribosomal protein S18 acetylase RimI-like enzyme|uniref:GNAT family N-acetyltransferase n=1 Tax=Stackebrandtia sp. TaxID=2023065 RepID=UPI002D44DB65|nr:GNAT family N-acetyltransferase [Stackebrandtia sp.]HZE39151.1 GNAT family N-acetyltransferase [Stackebrandtia sp.]